MDQSFWLFPILNFGWIPVLHFYSAWPFFVGMGLLMLLAATPLFRAADTPPSPHPNRIYTMDGLRGYLALAVFFQHIGVYREYFLSGRWVAPPTRFYTLLGPIAVALFFMITGYLFWSQMIRTRGRPAWVALFVGRVYRLVPLYLVAIGVVFAVVFIRMGPHLYESVPRVLVEMLRLSTVGILQAGVLNGFDDPLSLLLHVTWTLHYEWKFYVSLPLLALFARSPRAHLPFVLLLLLRKPLVIFLLHRGHETPELTVLPLFLLGMLCASLKQKNWVRMPADWVASLAVVALVIATFFAGNPTEQMLPQFLLGGVFYLITAGCTLFGLLTMRPALRLGDVSYGVYLLQGLALAAVFRNPWARRLDLGSAAAHWMLGLSSGILLIAVSTATHVWVERTGITRGKRAIADIRVRWPRLGSL